MEQVVQIGEELRSFIVENFLFGNSNDLSDEDSFLANGMMDSTGILELVAYIEEKYGFEVSDNELLPENFDSVRLLINYIERKLQASRV